MRLINSFRKKILSKKPLVIHIAHHKCGTVWFKGLMEEIAEKFNLKFQFCEPDELDEDTDMWLFYNADYKVRGFTKLKRPYTGTHMIRDPRDRIISAYFYHLWCNEEWIREKAEETGKSLQELLNSLSKEDGLISEIWRLQDQLHIFKARWNFNNENILELKYEEVLLNPKKWFPIIFKQWGFEEKDMPQLMEIAKKHHFTNLAKRKLGEEKKGEHLRQGMPGDWKNHFTPRIKKLFKKLFGDWLIKLGYEKDENW